MCEALGTILHECSYLVFIDENPVMNAGPKAGLFPEQTTLP